MRIAILSDIHDHIDNLREALERASEEGAEALLFCGDLCSPFMVDELSAFGGPVHAVFGNNDGDGFRISRAADAHDGFRLWGEYAEPDPSELGGVRAAVHHFPEVAKGVAEGGRYDLVCCGHTHEYREARYGGTLLVNPGEVMGRFGEVTLAVYDGETGDVTRVEVER